MSKKVVESKMNKGHKKGLVHENFMIKNQSIVLFQFYYIMYF